MHYYSDFFIGQKVVCTQDDHSDGCKVLTVTSYGPNIAHLTVVDGDGSTREIMEHFIRDAHEATGAERQYPDFLKVMDRVEFDAETDTKEGVIVNIDSSLNKYLPIELHTDVAEVITGNGSVYKKMICKLTFKCRWVNVPSDT